jgi:hypothetical protein
VVRGAYEDLAYTGAKSGVPLPTNRPLSGGGSDLRLRGLDCAVINWVHQMIADDGLPPYDTVRAAFIEGKEMYPTSAFRDHNHIQICVRAMSSIKGYFHPLDGPGELASA